MKNRVLNTKLSDIINECNAAVADIIIKKGTHGELHRAVATAVSNLLKKWGLINKSWYAVYNEDKTDKGYSDIKILTYIPTFVADERSTINRPFGQFTNVLFYTFNEFDSTKTLGDFLKALRIQGIKEQLASNTERISELKEQLAKESTWKAKLEETLAKEQAYCKLYDNKENDYLLDKQSRELTFNTIEAAEEFKDDYLAKGNYPDEPHTVISIISIYEFEEGAFMREVI